MNLIKIHNNIATREPVAAFLIGLAPESLLDLSWTDPALGVRDCAWWPAEYADTPYDDSTQRLGAEQLTPDPGRHVVVVSHEVVSLTGDEIADRLSAARERMRHVLVEWEQVERGAGVEHAGRRWLTTPAALQDIRDALLAGIVPGGQWVDAERQAVPLVLDGLRALWAAMVERGAVIYARRLEMEAATDRMSLADLAGFSPGWPVATE